MILNRYHNRISPSNKAIRLLWGVCWVLLFRPSPRWALNTWRLFLLRAFGARIGAGSRVLPSCRIWAPWNLCMGQRSVLGDYVDCYCVAKIEIGDQVTVSQRAFLCTATHDIRDLNFPLKYRPIKIGNGAWVCAEVFVGPGVTIGDFSVLGAKAVITKSVDENTIVIGNPARVVGLRFEEFEKTDAKS